MRSYLKKKIFPMGWYSVALILLLLPEFLHFGFFGLNGKSFKQKSFGIEMKKNNWNFLRSCLFFLFFVCFVFHLKSSWTFLKKKNKVLIICIIFIIFVNLSLAFITFYVYSTKFILILTCHIITYMILCLLSSNQTDYWHASLATFLLS